MALVSINNRNFTIVSFFPPGRNNGRIPDGVLVIASNYASINVTNRLVYLPMSTHNSIGYMGPFSNLINSMDARHAIGIISSPRSDKTPGSNSYGPVGADFNLPVGVVPKAAIDFARTQKNITIIFYDYDPNPWEHLEDGVGYILYSLSIGLLFLFNSVFSGNRLVRWIIVKRGIEYSLGFGCLSLEFLCNFMRVIQIFFWSLHNNYGIHHIEMIYTLPFCLTTITSIIIVFFWLDLTSDPLYHGKFMGIMKIPAFILILSLIAAEITIDVIRVYGTTDYAMITVIFYGTCLLVVVIVNYIAAYRILKPFSKTEETKKKVRKVIYRILGSGVATIFGVLVFYIFLDARVQFTPAAKGTMWFLQYFFFFLQSLVLITIFKVPKPTSTKDTTKETTKESTKDTE
jgi:hypothetical protein